MRTLITPALALLSWMSLIAQPPKGEARKGMIFGEKTTSDGALNVIELQDKVAENRETNVKIKGKVVEVCTQMGCWLKMATAKGYVMVKMKDHAFFVPMDLNGKEVVVDGVAKTTVTPISELKHYAEDAGKSKKEVDQFYDFLAGLLLSKSKNLF